MVYIYIAVVHVTVWCGDGLDYGVCAGVSVRLFFIRRGVAVSLVRVCECITELAAVGAYTLSLHAGVNLFLLSLMIRLRLKLC